MGQRTNNADANLVIGPVAVLRTVEVLAGVVQPRIGLPVMEVGGGGMGAAAATGAAAGAVMVMVLIVVVCVIPSCKPEICILLSTNTDSKKVLLFILISLLLHLKCL